MDVDDPGVQGRKFIGVMTFCIRDYLYFFAVLSIVIIIDGMICNTQSEVV